MTIKTPKNSLKWRCLSMTSITRPQGKVDSPRASLDASSVVCAAPLAAARAILFAQMVNDPGYERHLGRGMNKERAKVERERLFNIIRDLVKWENTDNQEVLDRAREEIRKSWRETCELNAGKPGFDPKNCLCFTIRSLAAARSRWRRSV